MTAVAKRNDQGRKVFAVHLNVEDIFGLGADDRGMCVSCGEFADDIAANERQAECEACSECSVYGIEELLMMGYCV